MGFRFAAPADSTALLAIYGQYLDTPTTFECVLPSEEEFAGRITAFGGTYPYLVWEEDGRIRGYAYAHRQAERAAYQWNAELSVYVREDRGRQGIGAALYKALIPMLRAQGLVNLYAIISLPNPGSEAIHRRFGFRKLGLYPKMGFKMGGWRDVVEYGLRLREEDYRPEGAR